MNNIFRLGLALVAIAALTGCGNPCADFDCSKCSSDIIKLGCEGLVAADDGDACDLASDSGLYDSCK